MRLIDADALYQSFGASGNCSNCPHDWYKCQYYNEHTLMEFCERIDEAPTVDPVKHGEWIKVYEGNYQCSECGDWVAADEEDIKTLYYCTNCGTKMDEERKVE